MNPTTRYTMGVLALSVPDAVRCSGGLIFDRAAGGWDVTVYVPDDACSLAIDILGAKRGDAESLLCGGASFPTVLVVAAAAHAANRRVKACVAAALNVAATEVLFSGVGAVDDGPTGDAFPYHLGSAARAFKKYAVQAAGVQIATLGRSEHFYPSAARSRPSLTS
ncbi:hypothetical protein MycrhN_0080 [Mycolicibacterium rhodesiae NBB3]|uniref:Uncharacterized protein n=2 Tax=Mycolicibacterium rhodesiae TaxID=36814 RepID=G8RY37_MYCRN|nr:hypothetical protein MycrhN_0080 [Mycolicibacterium rhodesiae NBB3]